MAQPTQKSWQARIAEATDAVAQNFVESISYDRRLCRQDIGGSSWTWTTTQRPTRDGNSTCST
jgi:argininosuccinate lyase